MDIASTFSTVSSFNTCEADIKPVNHSGEAITHNEYHDFLSFVNLVANVTESTSWTALLLNTVHITPCNILLSDRRQHGSDFSVSLVKRQDFQRALPNGIAHLKLPKLIAVKTPMLDRSFLSQRNRRIFASMTKEYQILSHKSLRRHENIISLSGCCWRTLGVDTDHVIPNLVFEGSSLGDLETFYRNSHQKISLRRRLGLCIDAAAGIEALHLAGVIHGDIKPRNILVFEGNQRGLIAKIADFGSSISVHHTDFPRRPLGGTSTFAAPEIQLKSGGFTEIAEFSEEGLFKADAFSLGITILFLVRGPFVLDKLSSIGLGELQELKYRDKLNDWIDRDDQPFKPPRRTFGKEAAEKDRQQLIWSWVEEQNRLLAKAQAEPTSDQQDEFEDFVEGWRTLPRNMLQSEHCENLFRHLIDQMTHGDPSMRLGCMPDIVKTLRRISTLELHDLFYSNLTTGRRMENTHSLVKILLGESVATIDSTASKLSNREIEAIILSRTNSLRELCFIWKYGNIAKFPRQNRGFPRIRNRKRKILITQRDTSFTTVQRAVVTNYMRNTKKVWRRSHQESKLPNLLRNGMIFRASMNERYSSILPLPIRIQIINQLRDVADSIEGEETRRTAARFEHAIMILCYPDIWKSDPSLISSALHHLHLAAVSGYHPARSIAGKFHNLFGAAIPESPQTEIEWLSQASLKGSLTAMQRLQLLDQSRYSEISHSIRCKYHGSFAEGELRPDTDLLLELIRLRAVDVPPYFIHNLAALGQLERLSRLSKLPPAFFNMQDLLGETPLVTACRCGQAEIVTLLLELGADPTISTYRGIHALHFLSAFEDTDIPRVARMLVQNGAIVEAYCSKGQTYLQGLDGRFDVEAGTPLLWAVIAENIQAIRSLLDFGADVFAYQVVSPWLFDNDVIIDSSPLESAIMRYRFDIIELLLSSFKNKERMKERLNELRLVGPNLRAAPLLIALSRPSEGLLRTALSYGSRFKDAQLMTVKILIGYGANPLQISREPSGCSIYPLQLVCQENNLPLLRFLWNKSGGAFRPPVSKIFIKCLETAMEHSNRDMFDFLVSQVEDVFLGDAHEHVILALVKACNICNNLHYVSSLISLAYRTLPSSSSIRVTTNTLRPDFSTPLFASLLAGNEKVASLLFLYGECDLGDELLSRIIYLDACYPIDTDRLHILLSLADVFLSPSSKEDLLWGSKPDENGRRNLRSTALHFAVSPQTNILQNVNETFIPLQKNKEIVSHILEGFHEPHFLNAQIATSSTRNSGDTALHIAAREGCIDRIFWILGGQQGSYFDLNVLNSCNETVLDLCIAHYETVVNDLESLFMVSGTRFAEKEIAKKLARLEQWMPLFLTEFKCNISAFRLVVLRQKDASFLFMLSPNEKYHVTIAGEVDIPECHTIFAGDEADETELVQLRVGSLIPFVDSPSAYGKVLSKKTWEFIQTLR